MNPTRFIRQHLRVLVLTVASCLLATAVIGWLYLHHTMRVCASYTVKVIPGSGTYDARIVEEGCDGIAGYAAVSIMLRSRKTSKEIPVFIYDMDNTNEDLSLRNVLPSVEWVDGDHLQISARAVGEVDKKLSELEGVRITYRIGVVEFK